MPMESIYYQSITSRFQLSPAHLSVGYFYIQSADKSEGPGQVMKNKTLQTRTRGRELAVLTKTHELNKLSHFQYCQIVFHYQKIEIASSAALIRRWLAEIDSDSETE